MIQGINLKKYMNSMILKEGLDYFRGEYFKAYEKHDGSETKNVADSLRNTLLEKTDSLDSSLDSIDENKDKKNIDAIDRKSINTVVDKNSVSDTKATKADNIKYIHNIQHIQQNIIEIGEENLTWEISPDIKEKFKAYLNTINNIKPYCSHSIILDLRNVRDADSSGISSILALNWLSNYKGYGNIKITNCNDYIRELFKKSEADKLFEVE
jgi:anti-anti-sigma regulatory factor